MGIPSIIVSDGTQEFITVTENESFPSDLTVTNAHSKLFNVSNKSVTFNLPEGLERGQMKSITYCKQDFPEATIEIIPRRFYNGVKIVLLQKGDHVQLVWSGFTWIIVSSINLMDPEIGPNVIGR
jgi:hypothetical protein